MNTLPPLSNKFFETHGHFVPGDLSIQYNFPMSFLKEITPTEAGAKYGSTILHEICHYHTFIGTTWGLCHIRYLRSWVDLGCQVLEEKVIPAFRKLSKKIPFPIQSYIKRTMSDPLTKDLLDAFKDFSDYSKWLYFDLGFCHHLELPTGKRVYLPSMMIDENKHVPYGSNWLLETAARIEDRMRWDDFEFKRWPFSQYYDFIWMYTKAIGLSNPLYTLVAIDLALNPTLPLRQSEVRFPLEDRLASMRFKGIINTFYTWNEENSLPVCPENIKGEWKRDDFDCFYTDLEKKICEVSGWDTSVEAMEQLYNSDDPWEKCGVNRTHMEQTINLRKTHPSIFAIQTLSDVTNKLMYDLPPYLIIYSDGGLTTIKDQELGTFENIQRLKKAIVEQLICETESSDYFCPFCRRSILRNGHYKDCVEDKYWNALNFKFEEFERII